MSEQSKKEKEHFHLVVGLIFLGVIAFAFIEPFTSAGQLESNTKIAIKECGDGNIKSVTTSSFTCKN
ncbi:hypothetical protein [Pseudoalteromonas spongiae]|uniref:hypothetical protein n=1 Tax=Pseudoalteromonas spongiae TaxID=298657 RepID=UPI00110AE896|nr:hypothetical protein [Pseudoalteromonas spongiae]TMO81568.1 hypothetical protein CWC15_21130 [Pseudoalteromonas spongiae]